MGALDEVQAQAGQVVSRRKVQVCGLYVATIGKPTSYGGGNIYPGARDLGTFAKVSPSTAAYLATAFGRRVPRPGYEIQLCNDVWLSQLKRFRTGPRGGYEPRGKGQFEVVRHASGGLRGGKKRRR